jgi:hypothetical protein
VAAKVDSKADAAKSGVFLLIRAVMTVLLDKQSRTVWTSEATFAV